MIEDFGNIFLRDTYIICVPFIVLVELCNSRTAVFILSVAVTFKGKIVEFLEKKIVKLIAYKIYILIKGFVFFSIISN